MMDDEMHIFQFLKMQRKLQIGMGEVSGTTKDPYKMTLEELAQFITWNMTALIKELSEATDEMGWKPWATSRHINLEPAIHEMVDAWHFFLNMLLGIAAWGQATEGWVAREFTLYYQEKNAKNLQRQIEGYDGVSEKCAYCYRELDDEYVEMREATPKVLQFCNENCLNCYMKERAMPTPDEELAQIRSEIDEKSAALGFGKTSAEMEAELKERHRQAQAERFPPDPQAPPFQDPAEKFSDSTSYDRHMAFQSQAVVETPDGGLEVSKDLTNPHAYRMVMDAEVTGEPLFCFRARDFFSVQVIAFYADIVEKYGPDDSEFHNRIVDALGEFKEWQKGHVSEVRYPD